MVLSSETFIKSLLRQLSYQSSLVSSRNSERTWMMTRGRLSP